MLTKLFKYEIKATARIFIPLYFVLLIYSAIHTGISCLYPDKVAIPEAISTFIYVMLFFGIFVMTIVITIQRFYKNLLSDEGYLMFTLPVKTWQHIASKLVVSMMWAVISGIVAVMSICITAYNKVFTNEFIHFISDSISTFFNSFGKLSAILIIEFLVLAIIGLTANVLIVYSSIAIGHLFDRHRILASLGAYIALNVISQIVFVIMTTIGSKIPIPGQRFTEGSSFATDPLFHAAVLFIIILLGLLSAGYFVFTNYILSRRLNLE